VPSRNEVKLPDAILGLPIRTAVPLPDLYTFSLALVKVVAVAVPMPARPVVLWNTLVPLVVHWAKEIAGAIRMSRMYSFFMGLLFIKQIYLVGR